MGALRKPGQSMPQGGLSRKISRKQRCAAQLGGERRTTLNRFPLHPFRSPKALRHCHGHRARLFAAQSWAALLPPCSRFDCPQHHCCNCQQQREAQRQPPAPKMYPAGYYGPQGAYYAAEEAYNGEKDYQDYAEGAW